MLGRLVSQIEIGVQGQDKPTYMIKDKLGMCVVLNEKDVCVTGRKVIVIVHLLDGAFLLAFLFGFLEFHVELCVV